MVDVNSPFAEVLEFASPPKTAPRIPKRKGLFFHVFHGGFLNVL